MNNENGKDLRALFQIDPGVAFLNHGSFGACPSPVFARYQEWQRELERQPLEFMARRSEQLMASARADIAGFTGADADDIVFVSNATTGVNIAAHSLKLHAGDEVLSTDHAYGALDRMWSHICRRSGAAYIKHQIQFPLSSTEALLEEIWSAVTPRTKVLFLCHIASPSAITFPLKELVDRARRADIHTIIDGAHAPGQLPLDLSKLGADFYAGNCHKWLMSPKGAGFLYARPAVQRLVEPRIISWGNRQPMVAGFISENEWQGTRDISAFLAVSAAIEFHRNHRWGAVIQQCHELVSEAGCRLAEVLGTEALYPPGSSWHRQMYAHELPDCDGEMLQNRLYEHHRVEVPVMPVGPRQLIRISVQGYNTSSDVDRLIRGLRRELPACRRNSS